MSYPYYLLKMQLILFLFSFLCAIVNPFRARLPSLLSKLNSNVIIQSSTNLDILSSESFEVVKEFLSNSVLGGRVCLMDNQLRQEMQSSNFWTAGTFVLNKCECIRVTSTTLDFRADCTKQGKSCRRDISIPLPVKIENPDDLKTTLLILARMFDSISESDKIIKLPIGRNYQLPLDFRFNDVPHAQWVRAYMYESVKSAVIKAVFDKNFQQKSKMQVKINFPEVNTAFDTYRIGTILECVRTIALALACDEGQRVRICVQQSLGEGIFTGLPLALSSMRPVLERMDWGQRLSVDEKAQKDDNTLKKGESRKEAMIRFGEISGQEIAEDDDVIIVIAPQNIIGGMVIELLEEMVTAANGRPMLLFNPSLGDRPSSNNVMQIRGRAERRTFQDSFTDIYEMRLLYPSSGTIIIIVLLPWQ